MRPTKIITIAGLGVAVALAGCANNQSSGLLTTSSVPKSKPAKVAVDPTCTTLAARINALRLEGTPGRVHKVATGKTKTVVIKRASLAKVAELDGLNAEFQQKCSKYPGLHTAAAAPAPTAPPQVRAAAAASARSAPSSGVQPTIAAPAQPIVSVPKR